MIACYDQLVIFVALPNNETISIQASDNYVMEELVLKLEDLIRIPRKEFRILHNCSRIAYENNETLADNNIESGDTLEVYISMCGGGYGIDFADLESEPNIHEWSNDAPEWRVASHGLCLEGKCTNKACSAYGKMVIMNMGLPICYQLGMPGKKGTNCPKCEKYVKPITCGFNNCQWRFLGIKETENGPEKKKSDWKIVGDKYHRFNEDKKCNWTSLVIETRNNYNSITDQVCCSVCLSSKMVNKDVSKLFQLINCEQCSGKAHFICINRWKKVSGGCPSCIYTGA